MRKLLSAGFLRLRKTRMFWMVLFFMFGLGIFIVCARYSDVIRYQVQANLDDTMFNYILFGGCCLAVFCSVFVGTEYSDGTMRNKLIVGHVRRDVFYSNLGLSIVTAFFLAAAFLASYISLGLLLLSPPEKPVGELLRSMVVSFFTLAAFASIFHMMAMLIPSKSAAAIACILTFFGLMIVAMTVNSRLAEPEFTVDYFLVVDGIDMSEPYPNPKYLKGTARVIYQFVQDFLPSGQGLGISAGTVQNYGLLAVYSTVIVVLTSIGGAWGFGRKDLR